MAKPELDKVALTIAYGHAYTKHVQGLDPDRQHPLPEFNGDNGRGRELNIDSRESFKEYLTNYFKQEQTKGFAHPVDNNFYFYNKADNVIVVINPKDPDLGTAYRPKNKGKDWASLYNTARQSGKIHLMDTPEKIDSLANKAMTAIEKSPNGSETYKSRTAEIESEINEARKGKAGTTTDILEQAVDKADEASKASKAAKAAKTGKLGVFTTIGLTAVVAGFIDHAHAKQRESAELFLKAGALTPEAFKEYVALNKKVEQMMHNENVLGQGWAFLVTTPIVENKAANWFAKFSQKHNLPPQVHQALGMSMFDGKSAIGKFTDAAYDTIPSSKHNVPKSLHQLIDSKNTMEKAKENYMIAEMKSVVEKPANFIASAFGKSLKPIDLNETRQQALLTQQSYAGELKKAFNNPETAKYLVERMPKDALLAMTMTGARSVHNKPWVNETISYIGMYQDRLYKLDGQQGPVIDKQRDIYTKQIASLQSRLSRQPEVLKQHVLQQLKENQQQGSVDKESQNSSTRNNAAETAQKAHANMASQMQSRDTAKNREIDANKGSDIAPGVDY